MLDFSTYSRQLLVTGALLATISSPLSAQAAFLEDTVGHKNQTAIQYLYDNGVIAGYPDGLFRPNNTVNRAELLKILVAGKGVTPSAQEFKNCFPDVKEEWFAPYVCYAKTQKWVEGYPDGTFQPAKTVNKVEAIKMFVNSQGYTTPQGVSEKLFEDADSGAWYAPYLKVAKDRNLLEETVRFGTADDMTHAGISENIYRAMIIKKEGINVFSTTAIEGSVLTKTATVSDVIKTPSREWKVNEIKNLEDPYEVWRKDSVSNKLIGINFTYTNVSQRAQTFGDVYLTLKDSKGNEYLQMGSPQEPRLSGGSLEPNEQRTGWVAYEVPNSLTTADLFFTVKTNDKDVERTKVPIELPTLNQEPVEDNNDPTPETNKTYEQGDTITFDDFEWTIENVYLKDSVGREENLQYPKNKHFLIIEVNVKNLSSNPKYMGYPSLLIGDQQFDSSSTAKVYGEYQLGYEAKNTPWEPGTQSKTFFGFDISDIGNKPVTLLLTPYSWGDQRAKVTLTNIQ